MIEENRKFERTVKQTNPLTIKGTKNRTNKQFNIDNDTIVEKKTK